MLPATCRPVCVCVLGMYLKKEGKYLISVTRSTRLSLARISKLNWAMEIGSNTPSFDMIIFPRYIFASVSTTILFPPIVLDDFFDTFHCYKSPLYNV